MIGDGILAQDETRTFSSHALKAEEMDDLEVSEVVYYSLKIK